MLLTTFALVHLSKQSKIKRFNTMKNKYLNLNIPFRKMSTNDKDDNIEDIKVSDDNTINLDQQNENLGEMKLPDPDVVDKVSQNLPIDKVTSATPEKADFKSETLRHKIPEHIQAESHKIKGTYDFKTAKQNYIMQCWKRDYKEYSNLNYMQIEALCEKGIDLQEWRTRVITDYNVMKETPLWGKAKLSATELQKLSTQQSEIKSIHLWASEEEKNLAKYKNERLLQIQLTKNSRMLKVFGENDVLAQIHNFPFNRMPVSYLLDSCIYSSQDEEARANNPNLERSRDYISPELYDIFLLNTWKEELYDNCVVGTTVTVPKKDSRDMIIPGQFVQKKVVQPLVDYCKAKAQIFRS